MADSKADTKGIALNLDKTFKKGLLEGVNVDFSGFFGKTKEEGAENYNAPETKVTEVGAGYTTKKGTRLKLTHSRSKSESGLYNPERTDKSTILSISKSFNKGGKVKKAYLGSFIAGGPDNQSNKTYKKYYKGML
tara:strand:+ start:36 stop:440 length:405 start_codon:yes stop_codon:yes gene_type:complete